MIYNERITYMIKPVPVLELSLSCTKVVNPSFLITDTSICGTESRADAKITGITPELLSLNGI